VCNDPTCDGPFRIAKLPPEPIPKGRATAGFLAHLLVIKFADHCPLYRFRKILLRQNVDLPLSTLVDYCKKSTDLLKPLWEIMRQQVLLSAIIGTDDTHVRVRLPRKKGVLKGHLWAYRGDDAHPYVVFDFTPNWRGEAPQTFLATFEGYVQADAYKGYDKLFQSDKRIEVGCWAHARRKWIKAKTSSPRVAAEALEMIGQLYGIEEDCRDLSPDQRKWVRQDLSAPVLETLRIWMEEQKTRVLPKSAVSEAIEYAQNQWVALSRFLEDGRLKIDNNEVELELRGVALGRKNWLACGSEVGGEIAARGYTMVASAVACGVDPVEWLTDVLERIVTCPPDRLIELLPDRWKAARETRTAVSLGTTGPATAQTELQPRESSATDDSQGGTTESPQIVDSATLAASSGQSRTGSAPKDPGTSHQGRRPPRPGPRSQEERKDEGSDDAERPARAPP
jgi:hypothetical protein